jgi:hypothetical protein
VRSRRTHSRHQSLGKNLVSGSRAREGIGVGKELDHDFLLVVKDPPMFTALLPVLAQRFPTVVLNPLAVLASWNSVDVPARGGRVPKADLYLRS